MSIYWPHYHLIYNVKCSRKQHTIIGTCCSTSYLWRSNNTRLLITNLPSTYITTCNKHKTRIPLRTQICTHCSWLRVNSKSYIITQNEAQSHDRDQKEIVHVCKRRKTHKNWVIMRPYLIRCLAKSAPKISKRKLVAFSLDLSG